MRPVLNEGEVPATLSLYQPHPPGDLGHCEAGCAVRIGT